MRERADIVVSGAINTDLVAVVERAPEAGETVTGSSFSVFGGGKAANQAVAARRSGVSVALAGAVGDDPFGVGRRKELTADEIDIDGVVVLEGMASGVALITVEREGENRIAYVPGPTLKITGDQIRDVIDRARPSVYLQPNEVVPDAGIVALRHARSIGATTVLNAAPDPGTVQPMLEHVDVLVVNEGEAFALLGHRTGSPEAARDLSQEAGVSVVLTAGSEGAFGFHDGKPLHAPAPRMRVVDTTGAGDTFCGAFAAGMAQGRSFENAMCWAVFAASLGTTVAGAQPSIPRAEQVDAFIKSSEEGMGNVGDANGGGSS